MTIGIVFTNGQEAIAITDVRGSTDNGRQTDSMNKMYGIPVRKFPGVVFGTGSANVLEAVTDWSSGPDLEGLTSDSFEGFVGKVSDRFRGIVDVYDRKVLGAAKNEADKKALVIPEKDREEFMVREVKRAMGDYEKMKSMNETQLITAGYDPSKKRIRSFWLNPATYNEIHLSHLEVGSGGDAASLYFLTRMQGIDPSQLDLAGLAFHAANAYSMATTNQGVGGTPKIARISHADYEFLTPERAIALANLSGAYLSEAKSSVNQNAVRRMVDEVLSAKKPKYGSMARDIGMGASSFTSLYVPYSSFQEQANRRNKANHANLASQ